MGAAVTDREKDFLIDCAMEKLDQMLAKGIMAQELALVVSLPIICHMARRSEFNISYEECSIDSTIYRRAKFYGFNIYIIKSGITETEVCLPVFRYDKYIDTANFLRFFGFTFTQAQEGDLFIFSDSPVLFRLEGTTILSTGITVGDSIKYRYDSDPLLRVVRKKYLSPDWIDTTLSSDSMTYASRYLGKVYCKHEPELQPTPELDEFIEQFRRK